MAGVRDLRAQFDRSPHWHLATFCSFASVQVCLGPGFHCPWNPGKALSITTMFPLSVISRGPFWNDLTLERFDLSVLWGFFLFYFFFFFFFFFCLARGMWKFLGQASNLGHGYNQSHGSDNGGSLTYSATREFL